jgi:hypothetical protein
MGTRSRIAMANADGSFTSIYCHWDGYPSHHGPILRDHYKDPEKVAALIALGDISSLGTDVGEKHPFDNPHKIGTKAYDKWREKHNTNMCTAYARDRGETGVEPARSENFEALCALTQECGGEHLYVFKAGQWFHASGGIAFFGMPADKAPEFLEHIDEVLIREAA